MTMPEYVRDLRAALGRRRLILVGASAVIRDGIGRVFLIKRGDTGEWSLPAGIMDMEESLASTVVREVREETGLEVEPVRLVGVYTDPAIMNMTYPHGDQVHVVNATFECRVVGGEISPNGTEAVDAAYFALEVLPPLRPGHRLRITDALSQQREAYIR
jgi:ADP-ribose pyrophosphatase YjhB (NUDIX family)